MYKYICLLIQEKPEMDDFERKQNLVLNIFAYSLASEHSKHFFLKEAGSAKNASFNLRAA